MDFVKRVPYGKKQDYEIALLSPLSPYELLNKLIDFHKIW
jgi:hypothetical protein